MTEEELTKKVEERMKVEGKEVIEESPFDEARRLNKELTDNIEKLKEQQNQMEKVIAESQLAGRGIVNTTKELTQEEKDQLEANKMASQFFGK